ncbi:hypothetical protein PsorP6_006307 [Peronosclerospora sorghi]|uniref:Uncharacterized protein n=1 Tax=Peronosclerospora sorghi TaxID=230839 RepID=A0ACC0W3D3_9STRA|nr:hypothetical protein PsorP6_006307 [Peronosclerospora sorghi]
MEITGRSRKSSKAFRGCYGSAWRILKTHLIEQRNSSGVHPSVSRVAGAMYNIFEDKWKAPGVHAFIASYLDPRFETVVKQIDNYLVGPAKKMLAEMIEEEQDRQREEEKETPTNEGGSQSDDEDDEGPSPVGLGSRRSFDLLYEVITLAGDHVYDIEVEQELEDELTRYYKLKFNLKYFRGNQKEFDNFDVITWWNGNSGLFPILAKNA